MAIFRVPFRLCCFTWCRLNCLCSFPVLFLGQDVEFDCFGSWSLPLHLLLRCNRKCNYMSYQLYLFSIWELHFYASIMHINKNNTRTHTIKDFIENKRATSWQNVQNGMCAQRRLRSAWASAQTDQSLHCPHEETLCPNAQRRLWSDWADAQADLSLRWAQSHFVRFVMRRLMCLLSSACYLYCPGDLLG